MEEIIHGGGCGGVAFLAEMRPARFVNPATFGIVRPDGNPQPPHRLFECAQCGKILDPEDLYAE